MYGTRGSPANRVWELRLRQVDPVQPREALAPAALDPGDGLLSAGAQSASVTGILCVRTPETVHLRAELSLRRAGSVRRPTSRRAFDSPQDTTSLQVGVPVAAHMVDAWLITIGPG